MARAHLRVVGRVQGVYFRVSAVRIATSLGLRGWVRNRVGGDVEAVVEGGDEPIARFIDWCHRGPPLADVSEVDVVMDEPVGLGEGFHVRPTA